MTFILAIQLQDSIIVAADNRSLTPNHKDRSFFSQDQTTKLHTWPNGMITGAGEEYVISNAVKLFKKYKKFEMADLVDCLRISRHLRIQDVGQHQQIQGTKLLCSRYCDDGAQLYSISPEDDQHDRITALKPYDFILWLVNTDLQHIAAELQKLYASLKDFSAFTDEQQWLDFYQMPLSKIFYQQSLYDYTMSRSFDIFFQNKNQCICLHIENNAAPF